MSTLYVRNVPDKLYRRLRAMAEAERRSVSAEVVTLLEQMLGETEKAKESMDELLARIRARRDTIKLPKDWPGSTALLREDRER